MLFIVKWQGVFKAHEQRKDQPRDRAPEYFELSACWLSDISSDSKGVIIPALPSSLSLSLSLQKDYYNVRKIYRIYTQSANIVLD